MIRAAVLSALNRGWSVTASGTALPVCLRLRTIRIGGVNFTRDSADHQPAYHHRNFTNRGNPLRYPTTGPDGVTSATNHELSTVWPCTASTR